MSTTVSVTEDGREAAVTLAAGDSPPGPRLGPRQRALLAELSEPGNEGAAEVAPLDQTDSLQPECTERLPTQAGSFIKAGRGGTSRQPGGYLPSFRLLP